MNRDLAVTRIMQGLDFRVPTSSFTDYAIQILQEAQRNLENGRTLPRFLLNQDQTFTLALGAHTVALPTGFIRESDDTRIRLYPQNSIVPRFLARRFYIDAVAALNVSVPPDPYVAPEPSAPTVYVIRNGVIDFITVANLNYVMYWDYYARAAALTTNIENAWLANAPEWLIGEAGYRIAMDLGNQNAVQRFDYMRKAAERAALGEDWAAETASGPLRMGANL